MARPKLLDLFCCAGGASMGYYRAGFDIIGVDIVPQPHYPFPYCRMDAVLAMDLLLGGQRIYDNHDNWWSLNLFSAIHASPPCQAYSRAFSPKLGKRKEHPDLIEPTRNRLLDTNKPFVLENVPNAPLNCFIKLDGTMFGIKTKKERLFELHGFDILLLPSKIENTRGMIRDGKLIGIMGHFKSSPNEIIANRKNLMECYQIDWFMNRHELRQAIPPAYTEFIGKYLLEAVNANL